MYNDSKVKENPFYEVQDQTQSMKNAYIHVCPGEQFVNMIPIPGIIDILPDRYYISNFGRVVVFKYNHFEEATYTVNPDGYLKVTVLCNYVHHAAYFVHRLVMIYFNFCSNCNELVVDHINSNRTDNRITNLRWATQSQNAKFVKKGPNDNRKFTDQDIIDIKRRIVNRESEYEIARDYNVSQSMISSIKNSQTYMDVQTEYDEFIKSEPKKEHLTREQIIEIYEKSSKEIDDNKYAREYNISPKVVKNIRYLMGNYGVILSGREPIHFAENPKLAFNAEEALKVYNECLDTSVDVLAAKYGLDRSVIDDIKFTRNGYSYLKDKFGLKPQKNEREHISEEKAIEIHKALANDTTRNVAKHFDVGEKSVYLIKFCKGQFSFLSTKYNLKPYIRRN